MELLLIAGVGLEGGVLTIYVVTATLLVAATTVPRLTLRQRGVDLSDYHHRIRSWWWVIGSLMVAIALGPAGILALFFGVSVLALREYLALLPTRLGPRLEGCAYAAIVVQYLLIAVGLRGQLLAALPVGLTFLAPFLVLALGKAEDFLTQLGQLYWGVILAGWSVSHVAALAVLPPGGGLEAGGKQLVSSLLFLVLVNDAMQYVWGRLVGRHPIAPRISPRKTWEGFVGGVLTTAALSGLFVPLLLPLSVSTCLLLGGLIGAGGFLGDLVVSAIKRQVGVKDTGTLLPGMGGIFDRVDSLVLTAPLFFHVLTVI